MYVVVIHGEPWERQKESQKESQPADDDRDPRALGLKNLLISRSHRAWALTRKNLKVSLRQAWGKEEASREKERRAQQWWSRPVLIWAAGLYGRFGHISGRSNEEGASGRIVIVLSNCFAWFGFFVLFCFVWDGECAAFASSQIYMCMCRRWRWLWLVLRLSIEKVSSALHARLTGNGR